MTGAELARIHREHGLTSRQILDLMNEALGLMWLHANLYLGLPEADHIPPDTLSITDRAQVTRWESGERQIRALHRAALIIGLSEYR